MQDLKKGCLGFMILFFFGILTAYAINFLLAKGEGIVAIINVILPTVTLIATGFVLIFKSILNLIFNLISLPFQLFKRKNNTKSLENKTKEEEPSPKSWWLIIPLSIFLYGMAGRLLGQFFQGNNWMSIYLAIGTVWGLVAFVCLRKGLIDLEDLMP